MGWLNDERKWGIDRLEFVIRELQAIIRIKKRVEGKSCSWCDQPAVYITSDMHPLPACELHMNNEIRKKRQFEIEFNNAVRIQEIMEEQNNDRAERSSIGPD